MEKALKLLLKEPISYWLYKLGIYSIILYENEKSKPYQKKSAVIR